MTGRLFLLEGADGLRVGLARASNQKRTLRQIHWNPERIKVASPPISEALRSVLNIIDLRRFRLFSRGCHRSSAGRR